MDILSILILVLQISTLTFLVIRNNDYSVKIDSLKSSMNDIIEKFNTNLAEKITNISASADYLTDLFETITNDFESIFQFFKKTSNGGYIQSLAINDYTLIFTTPYDGYLTLDIEFCELYINMDSQIYVKNQLKRFYLEKGVSLSIRSIKNLRNIKFEKKKESNK